MAEKGGSVQKAVNKVKKVAPGKGWTARMITAFIGLMLISYGLPLGGIPSKWLNWIPFITWTEEVIDFPFKVLGGLLVVGAILG